MTSDDHRRDIPPVGIRALGWGPFLTIALALVIAALASTALAVPAPSLFLLITVVYAAALGGWKGGLASALVALGYVVWLLTDAGRASQFAPLDRTLMIIGAVALPLALFAGWILHRYLQQERAADWRRTTSSAYEAGGEQSRLESDRRFRMLVEQVRDYAIFMIGPDGIATTWNEGVRRLLGYEETEFLGQSGAILFTPEDRARGEVERELRTAIDEGRASDDRWLVRKDGSRFWATGVTTRLNGDDGQPIGFSKVLRDLTDERDAQERLRDSEARLRVALHAARMGIWRWHLPTDSQRVDGSMAQLLGLGDADMMEGFERFLERVHPEDRERVEAAFARAARYGREMHEEFRIVRPDGSVRWLAEHGEAGRDESGALEYLTGAAVDVTERKLAEERLVQAQRMDAVGHLAGGVAHEINNMMTVILGFSAMLLNDMDEDPRAHELRQIHRSADRAAAITKQLLAFSRRQLLLPQVLDLGRLIRGLHHMLHRVLGEDKIFRLDLSDDLGHVRADPGQLEQVLLNLTLNARDAMEPGGTFTIRAWNVELPRREGGDISEDELPPGQYVRMKVTDSGHGMDAATRARVFEPFFTTKPVGQGTGLGLATAFGIVRQSGGTIRLFSSPGDGTTFNIYLPLVSEESAPVALRETARRGRGQGTVLVVEDEELVRSYTCRVLQGHGFDCIEAADGLEALELVTGLGSELIGVVTDVVMPTLGGGTLAQRLAELRPGLPVLFTSAYAGEEVVRRGLIPPEAPFLQKPFTPQALFDKVVEVTGAGTAE